MRLIIVFLAALWSAFAVASTATYYAGEMKFYSALDGQSLGSKVSVVKRVISPESNQIVEYVAQPKDRNEPAKEFVTLMTRITGGTFEAKEAGGSFTGTMKFYGDEWDWNSWDYDIDLQGGGKFTGSGFLTPNGIFASKNLATLNFSMKMIETLKFISEEEYLTKRKEVLGE